MKFLYSWINTHIDLSEFSLEHIADIITNHSSEVEEIEHITDYFNGKVVVGKISNTTPHPNADRLKVFDVHIGPQEKVRIVSAAPNVRDGIIVPVALVGATLPGITITPRPMRGETSYGMCCGKSELLLEKEFSAGLWELDVDESQLGKSLCEVFPDYFPDDHLLDIKVLPDRIGNIGNYIGMSHEIARALGRPDLLKGLAKVTFYGESVQLAPVEQDKEFTIHFTDKTGLSSVFDLFRAHSKNTYNCEITVTKSLFLSKINLVNPLADLSNFILYETGQPVHFFDGESVFGATKTRDWRFTEIVESVSFNGLGNLKETMLSPGIVTLQDENQILTIPAVTGGEKTKVTEKSIDLVIEIPMFEANKAMKNAFLLKYRSDGLKIWASRSHPSRIALALTVLQSHLQEFTFTTLGLYLVGERDPRTLEDHLEGFLAQTGTTIDWSSLAKRYTKQDPEIVEQELAPYLHLLGKHEANNLLPYHPAYTFIESEPTLFQELSYLHGVNSIPTTLPKVVLNNHYRTRDLELLTELKTKLAQFGFTEVMTRPFTTSGEIEVLKSVNEAMNYLRTELTPSVIEVAAKNSAKGHEHIRIFETARLYTKQGSKIIEKRALSLVCEEKSPEKMVSTIFTLARLLGYNFSQVTTETFETPAGKTTTYTSADGNLTLTELSRRAKKSYGLTLSDIWWGIEADCTTLRPELPASVYQDTPSFPSTKRDITLTLTQNDTWLSISHQLPKQHEDIHIYTIPIDRFVKDKKVFVTVRFSFQSWERTLDSKDLEPLIEKIEKAHNT